MGDTTRWARKPARRSSRSTPRGETVMRRCTPCSAATLSTARNRSTATREENCLDAPSAGAASGSTAVKRESSQTVGSCGTGRDPINCGNTSPSRYGQWVDSRRTLNWLAGHRDPVHVPADVPILIGVAVVTRPPQRSAACAAPAAGASTAARQAPLVALTAHMNRKSPGSETTGVMGQHSIGPHFSTLIEESHSS